MTRGSRRFLPSPAMVVALIALVMSLGGSAYALVITGKQIRNGSVTAKDIRNRSLTGDDMRRNRLGGNAIKESSLGIVPVAAQAGGAAHYAVVNGNGQTVRSRNVTSTARTGNGRYQVIFEFDVRNCVYSATVAHETAGNPPQNSQISVSSLATNVNGVNVRTENSNGMEANRPFHLIVMC